MLSVLCRATNPGSRAWDSLLDQSLANSAGVRLCCVHAIVVAMTGLHPFLHPALRPSWQERMRLIDLVPKLLSNCEQVRDGLVNSAPATKEAVRRRLASLVHVIPATHAAMHKCNHPIGFLVSPPQDLPAKGLEGAMAAFVTAGKRLTKDHTPADYKTVVNAAFQEPAGMPESSGQRWDAPWRGKGTASVHAKVPLVSVASEIFSTAFRANFPRNADGPCDVSGVPGPPPGGPPL